MSDLGVAEIPVDEDERPLPPPEAPVKNALLDGPILRTLLWLAWPNVIALTAGTCVVIAETSYIGRLGVESLAAMALVFPTVILTMTMSGGAMGGGVASAIARALGAGDVDRASTLAAHALLIGLCFGLTFMLGMLISDRRCWNCSAAAASADAGRGLYADIFRRCVIPWLMNTMAGILRGTGNMKLPSLMMLSSAVCQIILGGTLGLGLGPIPQFGMRGVAAGSLIAYMISISVMSWYLFSGRARVIPKIRGLRIRMPMFVDILKVGAIACFSPLQSVLTISIFTYMLASFGTEILAGYGIGARLEFMLTSIAFAVGIATVPMVGMAIGAQAHRAGPQDLLDRGVRRIRFGRRGRELDRDLPRHLGQSLHRRRERACRQPAVSVDGGADVCLHRTCHDVLFLIARRGQGDRPGAGADRAVVVHRRRRLVAVDARRDRAGFLQAGGGLDGTARRALVRQRDADPMGAEAAAGGGGEAGAVVTPVIACDKRKAFAERKRSNPLRGTGDGLLRRHASRCDGNDYRRVRRRP